MIIGRKSKFTNAEWHWTNGDECLFTLSKAELAIWRTLVSLL